ncbi:hypothetical protein L1887_02110 [Cichorium endivia]|nr:hypothetical protein L1887_02110 [Cichorium endivia]
MAKLTSVTFIRVVTVGRHEVVTEPICRFCAHQNTTDLARYLKPVTEAALSLKLQGQKNIMSSSSSSPTHPASGVVPISVRGVTSRAPISVSRDNSAKTMVTDQISQAVLSTSNLLHIMLQSSPSQDKLVKLPKNLLAKASTIKNTQQVLEQMPVVISSLDAHMDHGLQSVPHLETVTRLLSNIENNQLKPLTDAQLLREEPKSDSTTPSEATQATLFE